MNRKCLAVTLVLLSATALRAAATRSSDQAEAEAKIRSSLAEWVQAFNSGDLKTAATIWAPDLVGWAPEGADDTYTREQEFAARVSGQSLSTTYALKIDEVIVSGDLAVVRDRWTETSRTDPAKARIFRSFEVWRRQPDGSWKIARWIDGPIREAADGSTPASKPHP